MATTYNSDKKGCTITLAGRTGSGKTPIIKELSEAWGGQKIAYDPRYEYYNPEKNIDLGFTVFRKFKNFMKTLETVKYSLIVCEEATSQLNSFPDDVIEELLISIEHYNNVLFLAFHSLQDVPPYILRNGRYVILLETNDDEKVIKNNRSRFYKTFIERKFPAYIDNFSL